MVTLRRVIARVVCRSRTEKCGADCGLDWTQPSVLALARERLNARYGGRVTLEHIDADRPDSLQKIAEPARSLIAQSTVSPILLVDDEPRIWGNFDMRMLSDILEVEADL